MTFHRWREVALCHHCGFEMPPPDKCPKCGQAQVRFQGTGTEKLQQEVEEKFSGYAVRRMDSDTMKRPGSHAKLLAEFRRGEVNILITDNVAIRDLNRRFRKKSRPTDVLSFPAATNGADGGAHNLAGDIAISAEIAAQNAQRLGHSLTEELKVLILHGVLHLAGYDHETDNGEMAEPSTFIRLQQRHYDVSKLDLRSACQTNEDDPTRQVSDIPRS